MDFLPEIHDSVLVSRIKSGDRFAFEVLFKLTHRKLFAYAKVFIKDTDAADDIIQDTFVKVWEAKEQLREDKSVKAYLFRSVHNNCINYLRKKQLNIHQYDEFVRNIKASLLSEEQGYDDELAEKLAIDDFENSMSKVIDELPPQCREIFTLSRYHDLTYNEIAEKLGISINTVKTQISRAFQKIRDALNDKTWR